MVAFSMVATLGIGAVRSEPVLGEEQALRMELQRATAPLKSQAITEGDVSVVVQLAVSPGSPAAAVEDAAAKLLESVDTDDDATVLEHLGVVALRATPDGLDELVASGLVSRIEHDELLRPALADSTSIIGSRAANASGFTGQNLTVAVVDSGVDGNHPALRGKVIYEACFTNGACGNGASVSSGPGAGAPCRFGDGCEHGTHVAGVIASQDPNNPGVSPGVTLAAFQVFSPASGASCGGLSACPRARTSDVLAALNHLVEVAANPAWTAGQLVAVNLSLSSDTTAASCDESILKGAIDRLRGAGVATIVAAGNAGDPNRLGIPACITTAISVGATDKADAFWPVSNYGAGLSLLAPGVNVISTWPGGGWRAASGTSTASPHVAGAWALAVQANGNNRNVDAILNWLQQRGRPIAYNGLSRPRVSLAGLGGDGFNAVTGVEYAAPANAVAVVGDFDGNGSDDIFWFDQRGARSQIWWFEANGSYTVQASSMSGDFRPVAGDFNGDGVADLFWYSPSGASWFWWGSRTRGAFAGNGPYYPYGNFRPVAGDFNGDGRADILLYAPNGTSYVYWMEPAPAPVFARVSSATVASAPRGTTFTPVTGDFNGDGFADVLWVNSAGGSIIHRYGRGGGVASTTNVWQWSGNAAVGRFDSDRTDDIVWFAPGSGATSSLWTRDGGSQRDVFFNGASDSYVVAGNFEGTRTSRSEILVVRRAGGATLYRAPA